MEKHEEKHEETGGTLLVQMTIKANFTVASVDCNVFTLTELIEQIKADPIGWFIDMQLGEPTPPFRAEDESPDDDGSVSEADQRLMEKYEVVRLDVRPMEEIAQTDVQIEVLEKYLALDPDDFPLDATDAELRVPLDKNDPRP